MRTYATSLGFSIATALRDRAYWMSDHWVGKYTQEHRDYMLSVAVWAVETTLRHYEEVYT